MLPFWNFFGQEKKLHFEDKEKGVQGTFYQKNFSGKQGSMRFEGTVQGFSLESTGNPWLNMLSSMNPFNLLASKEPKSLPRDTREDA
jgi:hypothetical protein